MRPIEDMLAALELYYTFDSKNPALYNNTQREILMKLYGAYGIEFLGKLMKEITKVHEIKFRTLPDAAVFSKVLHSMGDPRTYRPQQKALPMPEFDMDTYLDENDRAVEEGAEKERNRVRAKRHRTVAEEWWLECSEYGQQLPMPDKWKPGDPFPPQESLRRMARGGKTNSLFHHGKRGKVPSRK